MNDYSQHITALRTLAELARASSDINMQSKAATIEWLAGEWDNCLLEQRVQILMSTSTANSP